MCHASAGSDTVSAHIRPVAAMIANIAIVHGVIFIFIEVYYYNYLAVIRQMAKKLSQIGYSSNKYFTLLIKGLAITGNHVFFFTR